MSVAKWFVLAVCVAVVSVAAGCATMKTRAAEDAEAAALIADLQSDDPVTVLNAEKGLEAMGDRALPALKGFAVASPTEGQDTAVRLIGKVGGEPAAQALVQVLQEAAPHLRKDMVAELVRLDDAAIDPIIQALPKAGDNAVLDMQTVLLLVGDKTTVDKIVYKLKNHLEESDKLTPEVAQARSNMVSVLRAMTGHSAGYDKLAPADDQRRALNEWISWWGKNRDVVELD
jgi:hypothetical protein